MNDGSVYGQVLVNVPAPELVEQGYILPPKVVVKRIDMPDDSRNRYEHDCDNLLATLDEIDVDKVLICARATKQIVGLVSQTKFCNELQSRGYNWMYITSKTGAIINGTKTTRENFFDTLNKWGKDSNCKFVVLHHSILSEGINVKGLEAAVFLRNMDYVGISQTIGRVIRKGDESKVYGLVVIPAADRVGISTAKRVSAVVNTIFNEGKAAISEIRR
jgi:superfamily II DNA or RNA helicase